MKRIILANLIFFLTSLTLAGCSAYHEAVKSIKTSVNDIFSPAEDTRMAQELAWDGMDDYDSGNYRDAIEAFQRLKDIYPFSKYAILAELKLGDAHYQLKQYDDAVFAYEEFEKLHPRNEAVPYVIFQIGRCHYERMTTIDRDQTAAANALNAFRRLQQQFPDDSYAVSAGPLIVECQKSLAGHEFIIGKFYFGSKHYLGARQRFANVIARYPDAGYHQEALEYLARCDEKLSQQPDNGNRKPGGRHRDLESSDAENIEE
jgi:outer membrane protein assembly factor BamD